MSSILRVSVLAVLAIVVSGRLAHGQVDTSMCQSCYAWTNPPDSHLWYKDAQCCFMDSDCPLQGHVEGSFMSACWITYIPDGYGCAGYGSNSCLRPGHENPCEGAGCNELCPVIVDLDSNGFHLVGLDAGVRFDLAATGVPVFTSWTSAGSRDAFLCWDRNGSGHIESGRELFGNRTLLQNGSRASSGYEALRELDTPAMGGNGDGKLTAADAKFKELCVWIDEDHDGMSDPGEVLSLAQAGIVEISFDYSVSRRRDSYGNEFRYQSTAKIQNAQGHARSVATYDVFFVTSSGPPSH